MKLIAVLENILNDESLKNSIKSELIRIRDKYGDDRH